MVEEKTSMSRGEKQLNPTSSARPIVHSCSCELVEFYNFQIRANADGSRAGGGEFSFMIAIAADATEVHAEVDLICKRVIFHVMSFNISPLLFFLFDLVFCSYSM